MKNIGCLIFFLVSALNLQAQEKTPNNAIGISFVQLQPRLVNYGLRFSPIMHLGLSYEHKLGKSYSMSLEGIYKSGYNKMACIDCAGAKGKMKEYNLKIGINRYFILNKKFNFFAQSQLFFEDTNVDSGTYNWNIDGALSEGWYRYIDYYGLELSIGAEYLIANSLSIYINPSLQMGKQRDINPFFDSQYRTIFNFAFLENLGLKYRF